MEIRNENLKRVFFEVEMQLIYSCFLIKHRFFSPPACNNLAMRLSV